MLLWNRQAMITFGPKTGDRIRITGLRIAFEIEKTSSSFANSARIVIYNLSPDHWTILESTEPLVVILEAGYENGIDEIYHGDIEKSVYVKQGTDMIATIEGKSGQQSMMESRLDKSYEEGINVKTIIEDTAKAVKDAGGVVIKAAKDFLKSGEISDVIAQTGLAVSGIGKDILDRFMPRLGLEWSIQDNELQIIPWGGHTTEEVVLLTPKTGLIGSPIKREEGIEFTSLLQGRIKPGRLVRIQSERINGDFRVRKAKLTGDTHEQPWYVMAEAMEA